MVLKSKHNQEVEIATFYVKQQRNGIVMGACEGNGPHEWIWRNGLEKSNQNEIKIKIGWSFICEETSIYVMLGWPHPLYDLPLN